MDWHPIQGRVAIFSVASCYINRVKLGPCGPPLLVCDYHFVSKKLKYEIG